MISEPLRNPLSLFDVRGKVALVTGASGSLGRAIAIALAALGAKLVLASGSQAELDSVLAEVKEVGGEAIAINRRPDSLEDAQAMLQAGLDVARFASLADVIRADTFAVKGPVLFKSCGWAGWDLAAARTALAVSP